MSSQERGTFDSLFIGVKVQIGNLDNGLLASMTHHMAAIVHQSVTTIYCYMFSCRISGKVLCLCYDSTFPSASVWQLQGGRPQPQTCARMLFTTVTCYFHFGVDLRTVLLALVNSLQSRAISLLVWIYVQCYLFLSIVYSHTILSFRCCARYIIGIYWSIFSNIIAQRG